MTLTASQLRQNIYRILDQVLETGVPVVVRRDGRELRIVPVQPAAGAKLDNLRPHPKAVVGDPEDLVHMDWSGEWRP